MRSITSNMKNIEIKFIYAHIPPKETWPTFAILNQCSLSTNKPNPHTLNNIHEHKPENLGGRTGIVYCMYQNNIFQPQD